MYCACMPCWWPRAAASAVEGASGSACYVTASPSQGPMLSAIEGLKAHLEIEGGRVQGAAVQALQHVRQQGGQQLRGSRPEGAQPAQPLLRKRVHAALTCYCSTVLTSPTHSWHSCSMTSLNEKVSPANAAGVASRKHAYVQCALVRVQCTVAGACATWVTKQV